MRFRRSVPSLASLGKPKKRRQSPEHQLQVRVIRELEPILLPDIYVAAIPNGGFRRITEAVRLKDEGVRAGIGDLILLAPHGIAAFMELKAGRGSLSDEQIGFRSMCRRNGHLWAEVRSVADAIKACQKWGFLREPGQ